MRAALPLVLAACAGPDYLPPSKPVPPVVEDAALTSTLVSEPDYSDDLDEPPLPELPPVEPEVWLKGSTHVHAKASGDSSEPNASVVAWYEQHHYDFIVLTDHNRISELEPGADTHGHVALRDSKQSPIVLSGIELTHNPVGCLPIGDPSKKCRIHVNLLGPTARPSGKIDWAERKSKQRIDMYQRALDVQRRLGGLAQINHPQWLWGMTPDLLVELSHRGVRLVEVANAAFSKWNVGDAEHPSMDALWDAALERGAILWGVASDDAHDYYGAHRKYPPGGAWVEVHARRDPQAILDALAAGRFYASNGPVLDQAGVIGDELVVEVAPNEPGAYTIDFIENGKHVESDVGRSARRTLPQTGYVRAIVTRDDRTHAWVQPARRP